MKTIIGFVLFISAVSYSQNAEDYVKKADSFAAALKFKEAVEYYTLASNQKPDNLIYYQRAMSYIGDKDYLNTIKDLSTFIESNPDDLLADAYFLRGMSLMQTCQGEKCGCPDLQKAKELGFKTNWNVLLMMCD